jgi:hypothetical protein
MNVDRLKEGVGRWTVLALATVGFVGWAPYRLIPFRKFKGGGLLGTLVGWGLFGAGPRSAWGSDLRRWFCW